MVDEVGEVVDAGFAGVLVLAQRHRQPGQREAAQGLALRLVLQVDVANLCPQRRLREDVVLGGLRRLETDDDRGDAECQCDDRHGEPGRDLRPDPQPHTKGVGERGASI